MTNNNTVAMQKCPFCGGKMKRKSVESEAIWGKFSVKISGIDADVCEECNEAFFDIEDAKLLEKVAQSLEGSDQQPLKDDWSSPVLNLSETAQLLRVSNQSVYNMIKSGRIKAKKIGREWRFLKSEIVSMVSPSEELNVAARNARNISENDKEILKRLFEEEK